LAAFDELHTEVALAIALAHFMNGNDAGMIQARSSFSFPAKPFHMRLARPLTEANYFQSHYAIQTLLTGTKHYALTSTTYFLQQFIVAEFSQHRCKSLALGRRTLWFISETGIGDPGYSFFLVEQTKTTLKKASWADSFWRGGKNLRTALPASSNYRNHLMT
jgi:hypothetical protein